MSDAGRPMDTSGVRILPPLVYLFGTGFGFLVDLFWRARIVSGALVVPLRVLGILFIAGFLGLSLWAIGTFRRVGTSPHPMEPTTALALGGPYRYTRNPMYLGMALLSVALALLANALAPLLMVPVILIVMQRAVIAREERYLLTKFGDEYARYKARVRRWV